MKGYQDTPLPGFVRPGRKVRISKGTPCQSRGRDYVAGRAATVTIHHTLSGCSLVLGALYPDGTFYPQVRCKDVAHMAERRGHKDPYRDEKATFEFLRNHKDAEIRPNAYHPDDPKAHKEVWFHSDDPTVVWAGRGGYWVEAPVAACQPAE